MTQTIESALNSYVSPISKDFPFNKPIKRTETIRSGMDLTELSVWVDSLALSPTQKMSRNIRMKKRIVNDGLAQYVERKDKKTGKKIIVDRHSQTDEKTDLIPSYLVSYCQRKLTRLRQGKGKGKNIDFDSGFKESYNRKKDGKRMLRALPGRYLRGSQDHIRQSSIEDALDAVQSALVSWIELNQKLWLSRLDETELITYIRNCKKTGKCQIPCVSTMENRKPLSYRILAIGCFRVMRDSFRWSRKVDKVIWSNRHGIERVGDEMAKTELAKGMPPIVTMPIQEIREELDQLPTESRTQRNVKNILLMRLNGHSCKDIADITGFPYGYVRKCLTKFRNANPYLCGKILTPV